MGLPVSSNPMAGVRRRRWVRFPRIPAIPYVATLSGFWDRRFFPRNPLQSAKNRQSVTTSRHHENLWIHYPMDTGRPVETVLAHSRARPVTDELRQLV